MQFAINRRTFIQRVGIGAAATSLGNLAAPGMADVAATSVARKPYNGPNVIVVRFGGGVRRRETIDVDHTYSPFMTKVLAKRATLYTGMEIDQFTQTTDAQEKQVDTSHGQGTLHILCGKYDSFINRSRGLIGEDFEPTVPTLFEYLRQTYDVPEHQTLIINNENRAQEEFFTASNHHKFGIDYRAGMLSLFRYKRWLFEKQVEEGTLVGQALKDKQRELAELKKVDTIRGQTLHQGPEITAFWQRWRRHYGDSGLVNPRGDRLLTELAIRAIRELRPKLMMINYTDPDYVHWGNLTHYTRGIAIIDKGIEQLVNTVENDDAYRDNTVFVIVPDCGRDNNRLMAVPCQHHFNSPEARRIFAMIYGTGHSGGRQFRGGVVVDKRVEQIQIASTIGKVMGFQTKFAEHAALEEAFA